MFTAMADAPQVAYEDHQLHTDRRNEPRGLYYDGNSTRSLSPLAKEAHVEAGSLDRVAPKSATSPGWKRRNICIIVTVAIIIIGGTIGGSIGGVVAVQHAKSSEKSQESPTLSRIIMAPVPADSSTIAISASQTASLTAYTPLAPSTISLINTTCPNSLRSFNGKRYDCGEHTNISGGDITGIVAYSLQQCIDACSTFNTVSNNNTCLAVPLNAKLAHNYLANSGANSWLKNKSGPREGFDDSTLVVLLTA